MKATLLILIGVALALGVYFTNLQLGPRPTTPESMTRVEEPDKAVHSKASFLIFTNGTRRDFSAERYHNLQENVYISAEKPTTVNVKEKGVTWGEFFTTLPMKLTPDCLTTGTGQEFCSGESGILKFYLNGESVEDFLEREIKDGDRGLITFGSESDTEIERQLSKVPTP